MKDAIYIYLTIHSFATTSSDKNTKTCLSYLNTMGAFKDENVKVIRTLQPIFINMVEMTKKMYIVIGRDVFDISVDTDCYKDYYERTEIESYHDYVLFNEGKSPFTRERIKEYMATIQPTTKGGNS